MKPIQTRPVKAVSIRIPGSKSISHRALICASLARGTSTIRNLLASDDVRYTRYALEAMGASMTDSADGSVLVSGFRGEPRACAGEIFLGNSGTSMRLLAGVAALGRTPYILTGDMRMKERPMEGLLKALREAGVDARGIAGNGCPPVRINGDKKHGGTVSLDCSQSSQYLSSLLMIGPVLDLGLDIFLPSPAVSAPYIRLTLDMMDRFKVTAKAVSDVRFKVPGRQVYEAGIITVEPDLSNASYFWAVGAVTGKPVIVEHVSRSSLQGDVRLLDILEKMGCSVHQVSTGIQVRGNDLEGVDVDMADIPDVVPTLAVVAAFAKGTTVIRNIAHLREKECDRISAVVSQLRKMGITAEQGDSWLSVQGGQPTGARIETFNDHRIAMAFSIAGVRVPGMAVENPGCVAKSFPLFWETFDQLFE
ncbi:MAG: 3-phosphoshikimate 1-carboxyvinyltransferase [Pseudomonadota bacterium]